MNLGLCMYERLVIPCVCYFQCWFPVCFILNAFLLVPLYFLCTFFWGGYCLFCFFLDSLFLLSRLLTFTLTYSTSCICTWVKPLPCVLDISEIKPLMALKKVINKKCNFKKFNFWINFWINKSITSCLRGWKAIKSKAQVRQDLYLQGCLADFNISRCDQLSDFLFQYNSIIYNHKKCQSVCWKFSISWRAAVTSDSCRCFLLTCFPKLSLAFFQHVTFNV